MTDDKDTAATENSEKDISSERQETGDDSNFFEEALTAMRKERDQYYDQLLRKQAEFENYRRRVEREKADARFYSKQEILRELLNVLDTCERGLESMRAHEASLETYREGYELLYRQIQALLSKFGVEEIPATGQQFDPNIHEAIMHESSNEHDEGQVIEEIKKGYRLQDRLLRPAQVKVAKHAVTD